MVNLNLPSAIASQSHSTRLRHPHPPLFFLFRILLTLTFKLINKNVLIVIHFDLVAEKIRCFEHAKAERQPERIQIE